MSPYSRETLVGLLRELERDFETADDEARVEIETRIRELRGEFLARRADPARIFAARRIAVRNVLADEGMPTETAEALCDAWEAEADRLGLDRPTPEYRTLGSAWIHEQRLTRKLPSQAVRTRARSRTRIPAPEVRPAPRV